MENERVLWWIIDYWIVRSFLKSLLYDFRVLSYFCKLIKLSF